MNASGNPTSHITPASMIITNLLIPPALNMENKITTNTRSATRSPKTAIKLIATSIETTFSSLLNKLTSGVAKIEVNVPKNNATTNPMNKNRCAYVFALSICLAPNFSPTIDETDVPSAIAMTNIIETTDSAIRYPSKESVPNLLKITTYSAVPIANNVSLNTSGVALCNISAKNFRSNAS